MRIQKLVCRPFVKTKEQEFGYKILLVYMQYASCLEQCKIANAPSLAIGLFYYLMLKTSKVTRKQSGFDIVNWSDKALEEYISIFSTM